MAQGLGQHRQAGHPGLGEPLHHGGRLLTGDDLVEQLGGVDEEGRVDRAQRLHPDQVPCPGRNEAEISPAVLDELDRGLLVRRSLVAGLDGDRRLEVMHGLGEVVDQDSRQSRLSAS